MFSKLDYILCVTAKSWLTQELPSLKLDSFPGMRLFFKRKENVVS